MEEESQRILNDPSDNDAKGRTTHASKCGADSAPLFDDIFDSLASDFVGIKSRLAFSRVFIYRFFFVSDD